jgi:D-alanyl-D-alanine carboxypeptidase (penicillin-binding protein 5/6)
MKLKFVLPFLFYTFFFLFYPGDSYQLHLFTYYRYLFNQNKKIDKFDLKPIPYLKSNYYQPIISAQGVYVVDLDNFTPIWEINADKKFIPASTAKIITALVAYDIYKPEQIIEINKIQTEGQVMGLTTGEKITVENLLYGLLVHSANDAAYVLANNYGYEKFISLMNKKAKKIGMKNTFFIDPSGLNDNQYTSPYDLSLAARELLKNNYLAKIVSTKEIIISDVEFKYFHRLTNVNQLLGEIKGLGGLKTGYTENAGENLVSFYKKNNHRYIIVVLKSENRFQDTKNIIDWLNSNVDYIQIKI